MTYCGNSLNESPEECDDGNSLNKDGCSSECKIESMATSFESVGNSSSISMKTIQVITSISSSASSVSALVSLNPSFFL